MSEGKGYIVAYWESSFLIYHLFAKSSWSIQFNSLNSEPSSIAMILYCSWEMTMRTEHTIITKCIISTTRHITYIGGTIIIKKDRASSKIFGRSNLRSPLHLGNGHDRSFSLQERFNFVHGAQKNDLSCTFYWHSPCSVWDHKEALPMDVRRTPPLDSIMFMLSVH